MQQVDYSKEIFFSDISNKLETISQNIQIWKKSDPKKLQLVNEMIAQEENEYNILKAQVENIKIYIVIKGTISAGKSTFLNALLGGQILPYKHQECTKQIIEITYNEKIIIEEEEFEQIDKARKKLEQIQQKNTLKNVKVKFPSLFHKEFPEDLRTRIILVDTPGIKLPKKKFKSNPYEKLEEIFGDNPVINIWISSYTTFSQDQERIFSFLKNDKIEEQNIQNNFDQQDLDVQKTSKEEIEKEQCKEKLLFLLNKYDERDEGNDDPIQPMIDEICKQIGDNNFIFKISAKQAQEYRIMTLGNQMSQNYFIEKYFSANKNNAEYSNLEQCQKDCEKKFKGNIKLIDNQEFPILIDQMKKQIEFKINNELNGSRLTKMWSIDYYLLMFFNFDFGTQVKQIDKLKASLVDFIKNTHAFLTDYETQLKKIKALYLEETKELIENAKEILTELNFFTKIISGNKSVLQELCEHILKKEQLMGQEIRNLNTKIQLETLKEIKKIEKSNEMTQELSNTCSKLFNQFSDKQNFCTEISQFESLKILFYNILGIEITYSFQTKVGMASSVIGGAILGGDVSVAMWVASASFFTPIGLAAAGGFFGGGMLLMVTKKWKIEDKFSNLHHVQNNLNRLKELQISRIDGVCENFISNNLQTINCLKNLFNRLVQ